MTKREVQIWDYCDDCCRQMWSGKRCLTHNPPLPYNLGVDATPAFESPRSVAAQRQSGTIPAGVADSTETRGTADG